MFDCDRAFVNINANEKLFILNKTIVIILSKFIPHETFIVDDDDDLPYFTKKYIKIGSKRKSMFIKATEKITKIVTCNIWGDWNL